MALGTNTIELYEYLIESLIESGKDIKDVNSYPETYLEQQIDAEDVIRYVTEREELLNAIMELAEKGIDPYNLDNYEEGLRASLQWYLDFAKEIIVKRSFPSLYDGLKPVQRLILYILSQNKKAKSGSMEKSAKLIGQIMPLHPHGEASIYNAAMRMTDVKGVLNIPLIAGGGNCGRPTTNEPPAAMRYTNMGQISYFNEFVSTPQGVKKVFTDDKEDSYYEFMPTSIPNILLNESSGLAVGLSTRIPSFNIRDVVGLVEEYIENGKCETVIAPDFSGGSYIIENKGTFERLMKTGKGRIKMRARVEIQGREIIVKSLPQGVIVSKLDEEIATIKDEETGLFDVTDWVDMTDKDGFEYMITCRNKNVVEDTLLELYHRTSLQSTFSSDIVVIEDDAPRFLGVHDIVSHWVNWRRGVVRKQAQHEFDSLNVEYRRLKAFIAVVNNKELYSEIVDLIHNDQEGLANQRIVEEIEDTDLEVAKWITDRKLTNFNVNGSRVKRFNELQPQIEYWKTITEDPDQYILQDMERIKRTKELYKERQCPLSDKEYDYVKRQQEIMDNEEAYYVIENGFIKKLEQYPIVNSKDAVVLEGKSNDVIICIDDQARLLKIYGEELPYNLQSDRGTFIPKYCSLEDDLFIMWSEIAKEDKKFSIIYTDGYVGHLDLSPFDRKNINQRSRVQVKGIYHDTDLIEDIVPYEPEKYLAIKQVTPRTSKLGLVKIGDVKIRSMRARAKVMNATDITEWGIFTENELKSQFFPIDEYLLNEDDKKMRNYDGSFIAHIEK